MAMEMQGAAGQAIPWQWWARRVNRLQARADRQRLELWCAEWSFPIKHVEIEVPPETPPADWSLSAEARLRAELAQIESEIQNVQASVTKEEPKVSQRRGKVQRRKVTATCSECDRPYETTVIVGETLQTGRCVGCAGKALLSKWSAKPTAATEPEPGPREVTYWQGKFTTHTAIDGATSCGKRTSDPRMVQVPALQASSKWCLRCCKAK